MVCGSFADYTYVLRITYFFAMCVVRKTNCFPQTVNLPLDFTVFFSLHKLSNKLSLPFRL